MSTAPTSAPTAKADALRAALKDAESRLHILAAQKELDAKKPALHELGQDPVLGLLELGDDLGRGRVDPAVIKDEASQLANLLAKLKSHYMEQRTKLLYVAHIVSDPDAEAPVPTAEDNERLRDENEARKAALKSAKRRLEESRAEVERKAKEIAAKHTQLHDSAARAASLQRELIDARLALARLRQQYPAPRLTTTAAEEHLDAQTARMQALQDELDGAAARADELKETLDETKKRYEGLAVRRAELEKEARAVRRTNGEQDVHIAGVAEWSESCFALARALGATVSVERTARELHAVYRVRPDASHPTHAGRAPREVVVALGFEGDPPVLEAVEIQGVEVDVQRFIDENDPQGLVRYAVAVARMEE